MADRPRACNTTVSGSVWLAATTDVVVTYRGGGDRHAVVVAGVRHAIAATGTTTVRFRAPAGYSQFTLRQDWTSTAGAPRLAAVVLDAGGRRTPIL